MVSFTYLMQFEEEIIAQVVDAHGGVSYVVWFEGDGEGAVGATSNFYANRRLKINKALM